MPGGPLCLTFIGMVIDRTTGRQEPVQFTYRFVTEGLYAFTVTAKGVTTEHDLFQTTGQGLRTIHALCFGPPPGGRDQEPPNVVNLDGSPCQPTLLDRWRWRHHSEASAAD